MSQFKIGKIDMSQIECRILNTVAGQWDVVEKFRAGKDLYSELASQFYGFPVDKSMPAERGTGKQLELSCGYGAGGPTIVRTARAGTYGPPVYLSGNQGMAARDLYRATHKSVVKLWETGNAFLWHLFNGTTVTWPGCEAVTAHDHRLFGPGGLWLDFTSLERHTTEEGEQIWRHRVKNGWRKTYGARLIENLIQWLASYPIRHGMVRISSELGLKIPLTVHDDIFMLVPVECVDLFEEAVKIMSQPLPWLPECPIAVEAKLLDALDE
jgi:hypothetical protein